MHSHEVCPKRTPTPNARYVPNDRVAIRTTRWPIMDSPKTGPIGAGLLSVSGCMPGGPSTEVG